MAQYDDIAKLAVLKEKGLITEDEFNQKKHEILSERSSSEVPNANVTGGKFTFKAVIYLVLGLIVPFWPLSLPVFWYLAYKAYKAGE